MAPPESVVWHEGTHTVQVGNVTVVIDVPQDVTIGQFTRAFRPIIERRAANARAQECAPRPATN